MFTGLIEEVGTVIAVKTSKSGNQLKIAAPRVAKKIRRGDSLAVSGCCLTLNSRRGDELIFDLLEETIARTNLKNLQRKQLVNIERAVTAGGRFGGHLIQGHIDCVSPVIACQKSGADFHWRSSYLTHSPITSRGKARLRSIGSVLLSPMFFRKVSSRGLFPTRKRIPTSTGSKRAS